MRLPLSLSLLALYSWCVQIKSAAAYSMLMLIVGGVGLACVKEGKGVEINVMAFGVYANV